MKKIVLALALMVLFSGCTEQSGSEEVKIIRGSYGVAISDFSTFTPDVKTGQNARLNLKIANIGNTTAENVVMRVVNYGELQLQDAESYDACIIEPSEVLEHAWSIKAPSTPGVVYYPSVQICYDYSSVGYKSVKVIDNVIYDAESVILPSQEASTKGPVSIEFVLDNPIIINEGIDSESLQVLFKNVDVGQIAIKSEGSFGLVNYVNISDVVLRLPSFEGRLKLDGSGSSQHGFMISKDDSNLGWLCKGVDDDSDGVFDLYECRNSDLLQFVGGKTGRVLIESLDVTGTGSPDSCYACSFTKDVSCDSDCNLAGLSVYFSSDVSGVASPSSCYDTSLSINNCEWSCSGKKIFGITIYSCTTVPPASCTSRCFPSLYFFSTTDSTGTSASLSFCGETDADQLSCTYSCSASSNCPEPFDDVAFFEAEINYQYCMTTNPISVSIS